MNDRVLPGCAAAIYDAAGSYFPDLKAEPPALEQVRSGLSSFSPDGLPYIGRPGAYNNLVIAGGHAMLGLSLSAATGKLVEELISERAASLDLAPFSPERFAGR
jgi:D-amino-acid dehydrogenase